MIKKIISVLICLVLMLPLCLQVSCADVQSRSITVDYKYEEKSVKGVTFKVYKIADVDSDMKFTVTKQYAGYPVKLKSKTTEEWMMLADTYRAFVVDSGIKPDYTGVTNADGKIKFSVKDNGMYLLIGEKTTLDGYTYFIRPSLVSVPELDPTDKTEKTRYYDVKVSPKSTREKNKKPGEITHRIVQKIWVDEAEKPEHPENLFVSLYRDGELYETVQLNEKNNWIHIWTNLPAGDKNGAAVDWVISEQPVKGYSLDIDMTQKNIFVITNTNNSIGPITPGGDDTTEEDTTPGPDDTTTPGDETTAPGDDTTAPGGDDTTVPGEDTTAPGEDTTAPGGETTSPDETGDVDTTKENPGEDTTSPGKNKETETGNGSDTPILPQTGQLWWPVPLLLVVGVVMIIIGIIVSGKKKRK